MSHTPGPFVIKDEGGEKMWSDFGHENSVAIYEPHGHLIARVCRDAMRGSDGPSNAALLSAAPDLLAALEQMNHMGGDDRGGYCICPLNDGSAPNGQHATSCADARAAIAKAKGVKA